MRYLIENHVTGAIHILDNKSYVETFLNEVSNDLDLDEDISIYKLDALPQVRVIRTLSIGE